VDNLALDFFLQNAQTKKISTEEAKGFITGKCFQLKSRFLSLEKADGLNLAKDVYASTHIPAFPQPGMDGYGLAYKSIGNPIKIAGEKAAGTNLHAELNYAIEKKS
jgi:molybdopterin biosynthesis enzyme